LVGQGEIEIIDVEPDVFLHLLKFLYTHRLDADQELNLQLAVLLPFMKIIIIIIIIYIFSRYWNFLLYDLFIDLLI
jgi:predicted RND superfamily exporter protein